MVYSIHNHISNILVANCKKPNDFSLIGSKLNDFLEFVKKTDGIKIQTKIKFKIYADWE